MRSATVVPHGEAQRREQLARRLGLIPSAPIEMNARARFVRGATMHVGEAAAKLFERSRQPVLQTEIGERARTRDEERAHLVFAEVREGAPVTVGEHDPAGRPRSA